MVFAIQLWVEVGGSLRIVLLTLVANLMVHALHWEHARGLAAVGLLMPVVVYVVPTMKKGQPV